MMLNALRALVLFLVVVPAHASIAVPADTLRVMTYNIEDIRTEDLRNPQHPRLQKAAAVIQHLRPDILLVNEMAYDQPGAPGYRAGEPQGLNARRFVENFLATAQADSLQPLRYTAFIAPTNTGLASGFDLDNNRDTVTAVPAAPPPGPDGAPAPQTAEGRAYGGDAFGFGTFPGQYGMALFVREGLEILRDSARTFQLFRWADLPGAALPEDPETGEGWYSEEEEKAFRLSSKSHWDVPVRLPSGAVLHVLASHPTPPAFDGPEQRNVRRNRDEIKFWAEYLSGSEALYDDAGHTGGLTEDAPFVLVGDLNSDPDEGAGRAIRLLLGHPRIGAGEAPRATPAGQEPFPSLDADDTARWGQRADYVLPSENLRVLGAGVWRPTGAFAEEAQASDHFPVWLDVVVP